MKMNNNMINPPFKLPAFPIGGQRRSSIIEPNSSFNYGMGTISQTNTMPKLGDELSVKQLKVGRVYVMAGKNSASYVYDKHPYQFSDDLDKEKIVSFLSHGEEFVFLGSRKVLKSYLGYKKGKYHAFLFMPCHELLGTTLVVDGTSDRFREVAVVP